MKKEKRIKQRSLAVKWVDEKDFDLEVRSVDAVHAACPNIIVLQFALQDTSFFKPPQPPMAA